MTLALRCALNMPGPVTTSEMTGLGLAWPDSAWYAQVSTWLLIPIRAPCKIRMVLYRNRLFLYDKFAVFD